MLVAGVTGQSHFGCVAADFCFRMSKSHAMFFIPMKTTTAFSGGLNPNGAKRSSFIDETSKCATSWISFNVKTLASASAASHALSRGTLLDPTGGFCFGRHDVHISTPSWMRTGLMPVSCQFSIIRPCHFRPVSRYSRSFVSISASKNGTLCSTKEVPENSSCSFLTARYFSSRFGGETNGDNRRGSSTVCKLIARSSASLAFCRAAAACAVSNPSI